ncbi:Sensor histidine kinase YehU [Salinivirga cyanobacteriivorans]|uniref:Sensor histidine kinase YehU n=2 Tax=Salinivirga cyanobacteriivorans TaxID=1307839 RepID=A0A0S2HVM4_9BACT|nr:Sensor histidine kinase YehU [Salinivirga cyanobacteriivorans]
MRQLLRMAMLTSPLIGIYTIIPVLLFAASLPQSDVYFIFWDQIRVLLAVLGITFIVFVQWLINIWLFKILANRINSSWGKALKYFISYGIMLSVVAFLHTLRLESSPISIGTFIYYPFIGSFANNTFIFIIFGLVTSRFEKAKLEIDKAKLELSQYVTQQEQLKNKIHPHFLFNTLNTLKLLIKKEPKIAEEFLVRLSAYLRFSITETSKDVAVIKDEVEFCTNYIELQKVRFSNSIHFENNLPDIITNNKYLPVVTFQSLAENAIKHNAFTKSNPLKISVKLNSDETISFTNNVIKKRTIEKSTGTGLKNLHERFKLLGSDMFIIDSDEDNKLFTVTFKAFDNENNNY